MKKLVLIILGTVLTMQIYGQELFNSLVDKYSGQDGFSAVQLSKDMFDLYLKKKNISEKDPVFQVVDNLKNIWVITQIKGTEGKNNLLKNMQTEILDYYKKKGLSLFKTENKSGNDLKIYIEKNDKGISLLGLVNLSDLSLTMIEINGVIDLASIASLNKAFNIRGLDALRKIDDSNNYFVTPDLSTFQIPDIRFELSEERRKEIEESVKKAQEEIKHHQKEIQFQQQAKTENEKNFMERYNRFPIIIKGNDNVADYYLNGVKVDKEKIMYLDPDSIEKIEVVNKDKNGGKTGMLKITTKK